MTTEFSIIVALINGETRTFKSDQVVTFEFMQQGHFFIDGPIAKSQKQRGKLPPDEIQYRSTRTWIPAHMIKEVTVLTKKTIDTPEEIRKYQVFQKHNIDIMTTKISHTAPPTPEELAKIEKEADHG